MPSLKYAAVALILIAATSVALSLGRLLRHRSAGIDAGAVSERWLSENRREE